MPGRILIIDGVATNRIVLKVKLQSAFYQADQASSAAEALDKVGAQPPDLILLGTDLPDMDSLELCRRLRAQDRTAQVPLLLVTQPVSRAFRLAALAAGVDDLLDRPPQDDVLLARLRSLLRARDTIEELRLRDSTARLLGFAEPPATFDAPASVLFATPSPELGMRWQTLLKPLVPFGLRHNRLCDALRNLSKAPVPDGFVISMSAKAPEEALRFLAEIRARAATRQSSVLVVLDASAPALRVDALDLGANDVMEGGFDPEEAALRLSTLIARKRLADRLRQNVHDGLSAALTDPLTGLYNRRYALPQLARIARQARRKGGNFAVMVADLDHFKSVNDRYGHAAGDVVLAEVARRMRATLTEADLIARIGGEEFLIVLERVNRASATDVARRLCQTVRADPVYLRGRDIQIPVTVSIGVAMGDALASRPDDGAIDLIDLADQALYGAKAHGRDQVSLNRPAA